MKTEIRNGVEWKILEGNDHAELRENSHAELWGNSHAVLRENSHAVLWGNSHAVLWENSHAVLWDFTSIHQFNKSKIKKGSKATIIKPNYPSNIKDWAKIKGLPIKKNRIYLYKVLQLNGTDFHSGQISYLKEAIAPDWNPKFKKECGSGLHLADSPEGAKYFLQDKQNYLLIQVSTDIKDCKAFPGLPSYPMKLRARACKFERIIEKVENGKIIFNESIHPEIP
jgi:hypothetical protein